MTLPVNTILLGDAVERLRELPAASVDCVITSPPYFRLRDYGVAGQFGMEQSVTEWVDNLRRVFREVARVLTPRGALFLNLGDSFSRHHRHGAPPKGLLLAPERLLLALAADGWLARNKIIWMKTNPLPSSVNDRLTLTYESVFFLVRTARYHFSLDEIRQPHRTSASTKRAEPPSGRPAWAGELAGTLGGLRIGSDRHPKGKNPGDVWPIATQGFRGAHFATFPPTLVRRLIQVGCPQLVCMTCGASTKGEPCRCDGELRPGVVLDPFFGSGTVGLVAQELGRAWLGIELNPAYVELATRRLGLESSQPRRSVV